MNAKRSIEDAVAAVEKELAAVEPADASLWAVVQAAREAILDRRKDGASWAQIAAAFRTAGFPNASETNVRLATQSKEPLKKVARARRRKQKNAIDQQPIAEPSPQPRTGSPKQGPALTKNRYS